MPVIAHAKVTFSGHFLATGAVKTEIWAWGMNYSTLGTADPPLADLQAVADLGKASWTTHIAPLHTVAVVLDKVRFSLHEAGGLVKRYGTGEYQQADAIGDVPGSGSGGTKPLSSAVCVSLYSNRPGPTGKGRFFLPQTHHNIASDFRFSDADADAIKAGAVGLITAMEPLLTKPEVVSSYGYNTTVTKVRVGRVPDTMRSRRNALLEAHRETVLT